jgi:AAA15 family ATPase/GTPase
MLIRLKVSGFKSLLDTELHFGPVTVMVGANASGKSNIFDAIQLLSYLSLSGMRVRDAFYRLRGSEDKSFNFIDFFTKTKDSSVKEMSFEADMIIPKQAKGDYGYKAEATGTFLRYRLVLELNEVERNGVTIRMSS